MQNTSKLISIIVPCYNSEKRIKRCINSLISQTYSNIEILAINDGSTDWTLKILNKYKQLDNRIRVFSQKNIWAGGARNVWIKNAKWTYITFVDSDDELEQNAINVITSILNKKTDIVMSWVKYHNNKWKYLYSHIPRQEHNHWSELKYNWTAFKLYKTSFLLNNNIFFWKHKTHEDGLFFIKATSLTKNIKILPKDLYIVHHDNKNSLMHLSKNAYLDNDFINNLLSNVLDFIDIEKYWIWVVRYFLLKTLIYDVLMHKYNSNTNDIYVDNYCFIENKLWKIQFHYQKWETFFINFLINLFILFTKLKTINLFLLLLKKTPINAILKRVI